ncbi:RALBP1 associated Eps domain containing isoform X2 [Haematobia irritans]|uniref:RALBP1 associated Eps domain containing isoform X2 n=1 Tax=Haematobia irritans TaxID=7368 RepID=UPI003F507B0D
MEEVSLTETESRYYGDLFLCCDEEKTGKIPMLKASELFRSANLSNDKILEITSLSGIPDTALHVSRAQFYSCLKLIAAHQASMQLRQELIAASVQLPLPRFSWTDNNDKIEASINQQVHHAIPPPPVTDRRNSLQRRSEWPDTNPMISRRNSSTLQLKTETGASNTDLPSTDSEVDQCESSCGGEEGVRAINVHAKHHRGRGSPEAWSTNSDSPTPTNSVAERPWAKESLWHGLLGDEHRQLLGTEEESSDRHSSDDENESDLETVYQITPEQREYYFNQFKNVQHDINGLLSGQVARLFFEKSRIPVEELRHIWQLCDVTRDGALSLAEFTAAMHLVVLRRNNIPLPATLPVCLHPTALQHTALVGQITSQEPAEADLLHLDEDDDDTDNTIIGINTGITLCANVESCGRTVNETTSMNLSTISTSSQASVNSRHCTNTSAKNLHSLTPPAIPPPEITRSISNSPKAAPSPPANVPMANMAFNTSKDCSLWTTGVNTDEHLQFITTDTQPNQWTKFNESPTSNVSSPGPKPINFDMLRIVRAVVSDPQILHPVPLRVTPVGGVITSNAPAVPINDKNNQDQDSAGSIREASPKSTPYIVSHNTSHHRDSIQHNDLRAIQRPQAKKIPTKNIGAIPPPPQRESAAVSNISNIPDNGSLAFPIANSGSVLSTSMLVNKKDPPPLPPPRPNRHGRSSSLDLNKFKIGTPSGTQPDIVAQASFDLQTTGFADFAIGFSDGSRTPNDN